MSRIAKRNGTSESEVFRQAIEHYSRGQGAAELAGELIGSADIVEAEINELK